MRRKQKPRRAPKIAGTVPSGKEGKEKKYSEKTNVFDLQKATQTENKQTRIINLHQK